MRAIALLGGIYSCRDRASSRAVLNGVLWMLGTGAQWRELPEKYPPFQTCHRRFQQWVRTGKLERALTLLARRLHERLVFVLDVGSSGQGRVAALT